MFTSKHNSALCTECRVGHCIICGKEFVRDSLTYTRETCSHQCAGLWRKQTGVAKKGSEKAKKTREERYGFSDLRHIEHIYHKKCKWCGKEFETTQPRQEYCGDDWGSCPVCGKLVKIKDYHIGPQVCSEECRIQRIKNTNVDKYGCENVFQNEEIKQKSKETLMEKYGVEHYSQTDDFKKQFRSTMEEKYGGIGLASRELKEKAVQTNQERYGCSFPMENEEVKNKSLQTQEEKYGGVGFGSKIINEKITDTMIEKYGVDHSSKNEELKNKAMSTMIEKYGGVGTASPEIRQKIESTNLERYGVENPIKNEEIRDKLKQTVKDKYGVDNVFQSEEIKELIRQKNLEKYGVDNPMKSEVIQEKARITNLERYGSESWFTSNTRYETVMVDPSKLDVFKEFKKDPRTFILNNFEEHPTLQNLADMTGVCVATISRYVLETQCQDVVKRQKSNMEDEVVEFLYSLNPNLQILVDNRSAIYPQEIDIYLPEHNLGIECDPTYTHNSSIPDCWSEYPKSYNYHQKKSFECIDKGIFLFHIFGTDWSNRQYVIKSMLRNLLGYVDTKYYARKLKVVEIDSATCEKFLNENHRQGMLSSKVRLGLRTENDLLVSVMTFSKMRSGIGLKDTDTDNTWELSRFCSLLNTSVVGGASKLFRYFIDKYHPDKVVSFSDVAHTKGNLYSTLGFDFVSLSDPGYVWVEYDSDLVLSRDKCRKENLKKLFNDNTIDVENKTEKEIMMEHGFVQVFDCGVIRWEWKQNE